MLTKGCTYSVQILVRIASVVFEWWYDLSGDPEKLKNKTSQYGLVYAVFDGTYNFRLIDLMFSYHVTKRLYM